MRRGLLGWVPGAGLGLSAVSGVSAEVVQPVTSSAAPSFTVNGTVLRIVDAPNLQAARDRIGSQIGPNTDAQFAQAQQTLTEGTRYAGFLTGDLHGEPSIIYLDLSQLRDADIDEFVNLRTDESVQILIRAQPEGSFLAIEYRELAKGSKVNNTDWGNLEANTTRDDSIEARVDNVPDDDEARAQGDKYDNKGRRQKEDD